MENELKELREQVDKQQKQIDLLGDALIALADGVSELVKDLYEEV